jgi:alpha-tubulin suppressor-like RCC1 family protein
LGISLSTNFSALFPVLVNIANITQISVGVSHSLALNDKGVVYAFGFNSYGEITV